MPEEQKTPQQLEEEEQRRIVLWQKEIGAIIEQYLSEMCKSISEDAMHYNSGAAKIAWSLPTGEGTEKLQEHAKKLIEATFELLACQDENVFCFGEKKFNEKFEEVINNGVPENKKWKQYTKNAATGQTGRAIKKQATSVLTKLEKLLFNPIAKPDSTTPSSEKKAKNKPKPRKKKKGDRKVKSKLKPPNKKSGGKKAASEKTDIHAVAVAVTELTSQIDKIKHDIDDILQDNTTALQDILKQINNLKLQQEVEDILKKYSLVGMIMQHRDVEGDDEEEEELEEDEDIKQKVDAEDEEEEELTDIASKINKKKEEILKLVTEKLEESGVGGTQSQITEQLKQVLKVPTQEEIEKISETINTLKTLHSQQQQMQDKLEQDQQQEKERLKNKQIQEIQTNANNLAEKTKQLIDRLDEEKAVVAGDSTELLAAKQNFQKCREAFLQEFKIGATGLSGAHKLMGNFMIFVNKVLYGCNKVAGEAEKQIAEKAFLDNASDDEQKEQLKNSFKQQFSKFMKKTVVAACKDKLTSITGEPDNDKLKNKELTAVQREACILKHNKTQDPFVSFTGAVLFGLSAQQREIIEEIDRKFQEGTTAPIDIPLGVGEGKSFLAEVIKCVYGNPPDHNSNSRGDIRVMGVHIGYSLTRAQKRSKFLVEDSGQPLADLFTEYDASKFSKKKMPVASISLSDVSHLDVDGILQKNCCD
jgi:hypothetical protein